MYEEKTKKEYDWKGIALKVALAVVVLILIFKLLPLNTSKNNDEVSATFKANMTTLKDAGYSYFTNDKLPKNVGEKKKVSLGDLISEGQVQDLKTDDGEACDIESSYAQVTKTVNNYELEINLICGEEEDSESYYLGNTNTTETTTTTTTTTTTQASSSNNGSSSNNSSNNNNTSYNKPNNSTQTTKTTTTRQVSYTVVFNTDGGTGVNYQYVNANGNAYRPSNPTKTGYYFAGWYYNGTEFNFSTPITKNIILKAKWVLSGSTVTKQTTKTTSKTTTTTTKASSNSNSLTIYNKDQNGNYVYSSTLTLYSGDCQYKSCSSNNVFASWTTSSGRNPNTIYQLPIGHYTLVSTTTPSGYETPSKLSIYIDNTTSNISRTFTTNKVETTKTVKVTYNSNGGTAYNPLTINSGDYATNYQPYRTNAVFLGWYLNGQKFNFNTRVYENITLVAKYKVTETYDSTVYSIGWGSQKSSFAVSHTLAIPSNLKGSQYQNVRIKSNGLKFNKTLSTSTDLYNYSKYRNDSFEGYVTNGWEYTSGVAANFATISSATIVKTSTNVDSRAVKWTGNVSKQCTTPFNFNGVTNACLYGISYNVTWEYEIER